ncbi:MAG TPA: hypothetical protein VM578_03570 [Candidatus Saccharimonadales bacterium]|nr:hypothetical protein [Candidatus Saccharimonadales bacterium]
MATAKRFKIAIVVFALLGALEWSTLSPETIRVVNGPNGAPLLDISIRGVALAVLALFAFRSWIHYRREVLEERSRSGQ